MCENLASYGYVVVAPYHLDGDKSPPGPTTRRQHELRHAIDRITEAAQNPRLVLGIRKNNANNGSPTSSRTRNSCSFLVFLLLLRFWCS